MFHLKIKIRLILLLIYFSKNWTPLVLYYNIVFNVVGSTAVPKVYADVSFQGRRAAVEFYMVQKYIWEPDNDGDGNKYDYVNKNV